MYILYFCTVYTCIYCLYIYSIYTVYISCLYIQYIYILYIYSIYIFFEKTSDLKRSHQDLSKSGLRIFHIYFGCFWKISWEITADGGAFAIISYLMIVFSFKKGLCPFLDFTMSGKEWEKAINDSSDPFLTSDVLKVIKGTLDSSLSLAEWVCVYWFENRSYLHSRKVFFSGRGPSSQGRFLERTPVQFNHP